MVFVFVIADVELVVAAEVASHFDSVAILGLDEFDRAPAVAGPKGDVGCANEGDIVFLQEDIVISFKGLFETDGNINTESSDDKNRGDDAGDFVLEQGEDKDDNRNESVNRREEMEGRVCEKEAKTSDAEQR